MVLLLLPLALAAPPETKLTDEERTRLRAGEVVVRADVGDDGAVSTGLALVHAEPAAIWKAVFDFGARVPESGNLESVSEYGRKGRWDWGTVFTISVFGLGGDLNLRFHWEESAGWCTFALDPDRENLLAAASGHYRVEPLEDGHLLTYHALSKTKFYVPSFVQRAVAERDMEHMMERLRARSEAGSQE